MLYVAIVIPMMVLGLVFAIERGPTTERVVATCARHSEESEKE